MPDTTTAPLTQDSAPLTPDQLARWRTVLVPVIGPAALLLPAEDIERLRTRLQEGLAYVPPSPSLCDSCVHAYDLAGGSVSVGDQTFHQRYCDVRHLALHTGGLNECESFRSKGHAPSLQSL